MVTYCADCGAPIADGARFCPPADEAACAERTMARYGGDTLVARASATTAPRDGETLGVFVFHADRDAWVYTAAYDEWIDCHRRAMSLSDAFGVFAHSHLLPDGQFYPVVRSVHTAALRAALAPVAAPAWDASDTTAHVADDLAAGAFARREEE